MNEIRHRVGIKAPLKDVYETVYQPDKLVRWWPARASGLAELGSRIELEFPGYPNHVWEIVELSPNKIVGMKFVSGPKPWIGSKLRFELIDTKDQVWVTLSHVTTDDTPTAAFQYFCTKWPMFLISLKEFLETGRGRPYPNDIKIQHDSPSG